MISIHTNDIRLNKRDADVIKKINETVLEYFKDIPIEKSEIRIFFIEEEQYYSQLGHDKPYRNLVASDGYYDFDYQEIFIRLNAKSIIRTYVHELGHYLDYNLKTTDEGIHASSAFTRKVFADMPYEDAVLSDIKKMPAYTLLNVASDSKYMFHGGEIFARMFEAFIWEKLGRKHFTPDLYIHTPKIFLFLNTWLKDKPSSFINNAAKRVHYYYLNRSINKRKAYDPFKEDRFSKHVLNLLLAR